MPGIIKAGTTNAATQTTQEQPYFHLQDLEQRGENYLALVRQQAADMIAKAQAEVAELRRSTMQSARNECLEKVREEMLQETRKRMEALEPLLRGGLQTLQQDLEQWKHQWEQKTVQLGVGIARHICRRELSQQPEIVLDQLQAALKLSDPDDYLEVHMNPRDVAAYQPLLETLIDRMSELSRTTIVSDNKVQVGGCLIRSKHGEIDAQIETQLQRIGEELSP